MLRPCLLLLLLVLPALRAAPLPAASRELAADEPYLLIPVRNGRADATVTIAVDGRPWHQFDARLASAANADWWAACEVRALQGQSVRISATTGTLDGLKTGAAPVLAADLYREPGRPQFHFTAAQGWINDPNGMIWYQGEWHLFYQCNPYGNVSANKSWGHAVSTDLVHWRQLPLALAARIAGGTKGQAYSGSAIIDEQNTAGFGRGTLIAVYTDTEGGDAAHPRAEVMAYSHDAGRSFTYFSGNPLYAHDGRDPRAFWYEKARCWVTVVYEQTDRSNRYFRILTSPDLKRWTAQSEVRGYDLYECPEFFALPVDGDPTRTAWVMMDASSHYLVGDFDGRVFTPSTTRKLSFDHGTNQGYALQTFNHAPGGRRIGMAWARRVRPEGAPFAGAMTVPMELTLKSTAAGPRLHGVPVRELETLRRNPKHFEPRALESGSSPLAHDTGAAFDLEATFEVPADASAGLIVHELRLVYDAAKAALHIGETTLPFPEAKSRFKLRVLVDHGLMEIFESDGAVYLSLELTAAMQKDRALQVIGAGRGAVLTGLSLYEMNSIWEPSGHSSR